MNTVYFTSFILLATMALMNLVTALMVESSIQQAKEDREVRQAWEAAKKKALIPKLQTMFTVIDTDGSGEIDLDEIRGAPQALKDALSQIVRMSNVEELFNILDYDCSGSISIQEFLDGVIKAR